MGCSCYTVVVVVIYYLSTSPVAEWGPGVHVPLSPPSPVLLPRRQGLASDPRSHGASHPGLRKHRSQARGGLECRS